MLSLDAETFMNPSSPPIDNCSDTEDLSYYVEFASQYDENTPIEDRKQEITFTCINLGLPLFANTVVVTVCDENDRCTPCTVPVNLTGDCGFDSGNNLVQMAGFIDNEMGQGIEEVEVNINNGQYMQMTDVNGYFDVDDVPTNDNYNIKPSKGGETLNGVSTFDIVKIQKHILGLEIFDSPYKYIAADVNGSGDISSLDMVHIRNVILHNADVFPAGTPSWKFIDANYVFSNPNAPLESDFPEEKNILNLDTELNDLDFVAVKMGDVTGNAIPNAQAVQTRNNSGELIFTTKNQKVEAGDLVDLTFSTEGKSDLAAWQFTLDFDDSKLEFIDVEQIEGIHFGTSLVEKGAVTFSWDSDGRVLLEDKPKWFNIQFLAKENLSLEEVLEINSKYTLAKAYHSSGEEYDINLYFENSESDEITDGLRLFQNTPNPFSNATTINYYLPKSDDLEITVFDITGKILKTYTIFSESGNQNVTLKKDESFATGVLYYQLKTSEYQASGKMILLP